MIEWELASEPASERQQPRTKVKAFGFNAAMKALADRKERELGGKWANAKPRFRAAEAARRARAEMSRRIHAHSGRRYAASTLARKATHDDMPANVDPRWLGRWAVIDRAGGIAALAAKWGRSVKQIVAWRDRGVGRGRRGTGRLTGEGDIQVGVQTQGTLTANNEAYPKDLPSPRSNGYEWFKVDEETALDIQDAWNSGDTGALHNMLDELITFQVLPNWDNPPPPDAYYTTDEVDDLVIDDERED